MKTIFTISYMQHAPEELLAFAEEQDAIILDVRYSARSKRPEYNGKRLAAALGERYLHVVGFGNVNYKNGGPIQFLDLAAGEAIARTILAIHSIMLMCGCVDVNRCHRRNIAEYLSGVTGLKVEHIGKLPRGRPKAPPPSNEQMALL